MVLDYFLYSVCEQCCDCIPMGTRRRDYDALASAHSPADPTLWKEDRGNCPAHAQFDVCKVLPNVRYFAKPGDPELVAPKICPKLREWQKSPEAADWPVNPETNIESDVRRFLNGILVATDCDNKLIWGRCYEMEDKQSNLDLPEGADPPEVPVITRPPTTTEATTTTTTTTTSTTTTEPEETGTTPASTDSESTAEDAEEPIEPGSDPGTESDTDSDSATDPDPDPDSPGEDDLSEESGSDNDTSEDPASDDSGDDTSSTNSGTSPDSEQGTSSIIEGTASCFPATSTVELASGARIPMSDLRIGHSVRVSTHAFSPVFLFSHRTSSSAPSYIQITPTTGNHTLTVTSGHYLHINRQLLPAAAAKVGDHILTADHGWAPVAAVRIVQANGLYNPHTLQGDLVVDGFVTSTYTTAVPRRIATGLLAPLRAFYRHGLVSERLFGSFLADGFRSGIPASIEL
ncbi:unnamed protein product [Chondrus crispus]|uniref:Hint domain-containing protein n=1 Tax=Chondrus crispus TaxID=2769 RepID=R7QFW8_CHOCR|nr:unnamed protein product [Chondrus crispus]CDF36351.1 unnamed protein product [Chondrus crispus]|eukprot:XP_005716170.1 unnamed protein product [Chondrus crispus]